uniref:hypothetical protein n=1 Tax=Ningiella ruwaisensis TaxID=2364274 RepID=UPI00109FEC6C|nr:hypothetical protein [Ningiella ruwaisensis]
MSTIHTVMFAFHILFGTAALALFWVPIFTRKGQLNHIKFGRFYKITMYLVAGTGAIMATMTFAFPLTIRPEHASEPYAEQFVEQSRSLAGFLFYLAILSFTSTRHGIAVLKAKSDRVMLNTLNYLLPIWALFFGGFILLAAGMMRGAALYIIFAALGIAVASTMLRYSLRKEVAKNQWVLEHIGGMIGSGIGAYTAFLAFGGRTLFTDLGEWQIVFWVAPGVIGSIASYIVCKKYERIFQVQKPRGSSQVRLD